MANAADIIVNLIAKTGRFERGMKQGEKRMKKFQGGAKVLGRSLVKLKGIAAGLGIVISLAGLVTIAKQAITLNNELGKFSTRLGIATDDLKVLQIAAEFSGQKINALTVGLQRMVRRVAEAAIGIGEAKQALIDLGIDAKKLALLAPGEAFRELAVAMEKVPTQGERIRLAFKLLDTEGVGLVNTMKLLTSAGFKEVEQAARDMNAVMSEFDTAQFEAAQDQISLMNLAFEGIKNSLTIDILPALVIMSDLLVRVAKDANEITIEADTMTFKFVRASGAVVAMGKAMINVGRIIVRIGLGILNFLLKPSELVEATLRRIINLGGLIDVVPANTLTGAFIARSKEFGENLDKQVLSFKGLVGEMDVFVQGWRDAKIRSLEAAAVIQEQREELREVNEATLAFLAKKKLADEAEAKALKDRTERQKELTAILAAGQAKSLAIEKKIAVLSAALVSGDLIANEKERNAILARRVQLQIEFTEAQQKEQGIETASDRAKLVASILKRSQKETVALKTQIASINTAIFKGEGDLNQLFEARKVLLEELIQLQKDEQTQVGRLTEVGLQALRNMQDSLADFFATTRGGFRGLISGFTDMLRKMVAQLLARRILLSFLGLFAGGSGSLAKFAQSAISGLQKGGPLPVGTQAVVGEDRPEVFVPKNVLTFQTISRLPRAVAEDVNKRQEEGTLPADQIRMIGTRGPELFKAGEAGTVVPVTLFSGDVLDEIKKLQRGGPINLGQEALVGEKRPEIFIPKNVLSLPTLSRLPRAVSEDVEKRHAEGSLPVDQIRVIGRGGPELFKATETGTVVPMAMLSRDVLKDIERRQSGGPLAAGQLSLVGEEGAELFIPKRAVQIIPSGGFGNIVVNIEQRNTFTGTGPLEPAVLIPLLEENNLKLKAEFVEELRRGTFA